MIVDAWLRAAIADAEKRGMPELKPLLEGLALSTSALRAANLQHDAGVDPVADAAGSNQAEHGGSVIPQG